MSGKRMLHDRICESKKIDKLSAEEERLYTRLLTHLDDYGNHPADPKAVRMACFPRKKKWNNRTIQFWLDRLVAVGLASYYEVQGQNFVHFERFKDFQKLKHFNGWYPRHPDDRGDHPSMTGGIIDDDGGGHEGMTGVVMGDEGGGQVTEPALISTDTNLKSLSKKEVSGSKPSPPVSKQERSPVSSGRIPSGQPVPPAPATSKSLREWDQDIDGTPAALIHRAIIYHYDHNPRDYHRSRMSPSYIRNKYQAMIDDVPGNWEIPQPKKRIQYDPDCPKCGGSGGWMSKAAGRKIGRTWQVCNCGTEVSVAAA
ncbi:MAG: hypothetical protein WCB56_14725 [Terriglobales bacterium]